MGVFTREEAEAIDWTCPLHTNETIDPTKDEGLPLGHEPPKLPRRKSLRVKQQLRREKEAKYMNQSETEMMQHDVDVITEATTGIRPTRKRIWKYRRCAIFSAVVSVAACLYLIIMY